MPITRAILSILEKGSAANTEALKRTLWETGECDPQAMGRAKAQTELIEDLKEAEADDWNAWAERFEHE